MTIKVTTWHPDTCECVLQYEWDTEHSEDQRVHKALPSIKRCELHVHYECEHEHYAEVTKHNIAEGKKSHSLWHRLVN